MDLSKAKIEGLIQLDLKNVKNAKCYDLSKNYTILKSSMRAFEQCERFEKRASYEKVSRSEVFVKQQKDDDVAVQMTSAMMMWQHLGDDM